MKTKGVELICGEMSESTRAKIMGHLSSMDIRIFAHSENQKDITYLKLNSNSPFDPNHVEVSPYYNKDKVVYDTSRVNGFYTINERKFDDGNSLLFIEKRDMPSFAFMTSNRVARLL